MNIHDILMDFLLFLPEFGQKSPIFDQFCRISAENHQFLHPINTLQRGEPPLSIITNNEINKLLIYSNRIQIK